MARRILRKIKKAKNAVIDRASDVIADVAFGAASNRRKASYYSKVAEDVKVLREVKQSDRKNNSQTVIDRSARSLQNPDSLARRQMRVDDYKEEQKDPKRYKRLFGNR